MIAIVSSNSRERAAFAVLCESRGWPCVECDSLRRLKRMLPRTSPRVIVTRHRLSDGFSDDVLAAMAGASLHGRSRVVVLIPAGSPSALEARQVALGADVVHRDPVRADVISAYLARFRRRARPAGAAAPPRTPRTLSFAGGTVGILDRTLHHSGRTTTMTSRESELVQALFEFRGRVATYDMLYSEILGRRFTGDTSNMRVLLGKLTSSFHAVGLDLRACLAVVAKTGYRYTAPPTP